MCLIGRGRPSKVQMVSIISFMDTISVDPRLRGSLGGGAKGGRGSEWGRRWGGARTVGPPPPRTPLRGRDARGSGNKARALTRSGARRGGNAAATERATRVQ
jgi:hypothetical protein